MLANVRVCNVTKNASIDTKPIMTSASVPGRIRVGRCTYTSTGARRDPSMAGFTPIVVLMRSHSKWGVLGPYELRDPDTGTIMENLWQFSKVYSEVPEVTQHKSRWDSSVIWRHPAEIHFHNDALTPAFFKWRAKGFQCPVAVRYPVGYHSRHKCLFAVSPTLSPDTAIVPADQRLDYIAARKLIYVPEYTRLVRRQPLFHELVERVKGGENLLIIEVDGPHEESLKYYRDAYGVSETFIQQDSVEATRPNLQILLEDAKHPFGHGYCLALALLDSCT